jgi:uncharacterized protein YegL
MMASWQDFAPVEDIVTYSNTPTRQVSKGGSAMSDNVDSTGELEDGRIQVLPFYIVCDESSSMLGVSIDAVNEGIKELFKAINADPVVDAKARVSIIAFNDSAEVVLPLTQLSSVSTVPGCTASGSTSYAAAFTLLRQQIESDVASLRATNRVHRPFVFFISDGEPNPGDNWEKAHAALVDSSFHLRPNIVSFGVAGANKSNIKAVATALTGGTGAAGSKFAFEAEKDANPGVALKEIMKFITGTIVTSASQAQPVVHVPQDLPGVILIDSV